MRPTNFVDLRSSISQLNDSPFLAMPCLFIMSKQMHAATLPRYFKTQLFNGHPVVNLLVLHPSPTATACYPALDLCNILHGDQVSKPSCIQFSQLLYRNFVDSKYIYSDILVKNMRNYVTMQYDFSFS
jgi:hypothetical protein